MELTVTSALAVFLGGALGGLARAWLVVRISGTGGLLAVNTSGSFALGWLAVTAAPESTIWLFGASGALGGYTSVSSFALQSVQTWQSGAQAAALANIVASVAMSVSAAALGVWLGMSA